MIILQQGGEVTNMGKLEVGYNDLQTLSPEIAREWHPTLNDDLTPSQVHNGSSKVVWWLCSKGHTYQKTVSKRTIRGQGCPICRKENHSFANVHPELLEQWDYEKNTISPDDVFYGSERVVWWKCSNGHCYEQKVNSKSNGLGCPICSHQQVSNDTCLAVVCPKIAKEWHPTKNGELTPFDVMPQSHKKVWWLCLNGHEYQSVIYARQKSGCPVCDSEKRTSFPEQAILYYLGQVFPTESRSNLGGFEADIYCPTCNVAIEYDGEYFHQSNESSAREERKNTYFIEQKILLIRIKETKKPVNFVCCATEYGYDIVTRYTQEYENIPEVISAILQILNLKYQKNYAIDVNIVRDKVEIINMYAQQKDALSFIKQKPLGARKWNYEKNGNIDLTRLPKTSKKKYWWKCPTCNNEWYGTLDNIVNSLTCNKCSRQVEVNYDVAPETMAESGDFFRELPISLQTENPALASQWHPTKNGYFLPTHVSPKSGKRVWWVCPDCGHEWTQIIKTRSKGNTARLCPVCANNQKNKSDSVTEFNKVLYDEWHPTKNGNKKISDYTPGSTIKVWWKCSVCETEFLCNFKSRQNGGGCPSCARESTNKAKYKMVRNVSTGEVFNSIKDAAEYYGINRSGISNCLIGKTKTCGGFMWQYCTDDKG